VKSLGWPRGLSIHRSEGLAGLVSRGFAGLVRQTIGVGFLIPSITTMALLALASLVSMGVVALTSSAVSVRCVKAMDASLLLQEGE